MKIIPVDDLIKGWTEGEREKLKHLIDECREREKKNQDNHENITRLLRVISDHKLGALAETLYYLTKGGCAKDGNA